MGVNQVQIKQAIEALQRHNEEKVVMILKMFDQLPENTDTDENRMHDLHEIHRWFVKKNFNNLDHFEIFSNRMGARDTVRMVNDLLYNNIRFPTLRQHAKNYFENNGHE